LPDALANSLLLENAMPVEPVSFDSCRWSP
jgi:hypothetical protein